MSGIEVSWKSLGPQSIVAMLRVGRDGPKQRFLGDRYRFYVNQTAVRTGYALRRAALYNLGGEGSIAEYTWVGITGRRTERSTKLSTDDAGDVAKQVGRKLGAAPSLPLRAPIGESDYRPGPSQLAPRGNGGSREPRRV